MARIINQLCGGLAILLPLAADAAKMDWNLVKNPGADASVESVSPEKFRMTLVRKKEGRTTATAVRNIEQPMPSQYRLSFHVKGLNDAPLFVTPLLSYRAGNGKTIMKFGQKITVRGTTVRKYQKSLDVEFQLGDALFHINQLKFAVNSDALPPGTSAGVEVSEIRLHAATDTGNSVTVCLPAAENTTETDRKIYFYFDNDDFAKIYRNRRRPAVADKNPSAGFRARLLNRRAGLADSPAQANLIVYANTDPNPAEAKKIAAAVRAGTPLIVCGETADPEIAELLPVRLEPIPKNGFPERKTIRFAGDFAGKKGLNKASFGIYRALRLRSGESRVLVEFSDGAPAVVEGRARKGRVIYSTFTPGADLLPEAEGLDPFLLRLAGRLTGTEFPETKQTAPRPDPEGWTPGASFENFGRFGYLIGDGLLTESLRGDLSVANGIAEYVFVSHVAPSRQLSAWGFREDSSQPFTPRPWNRKWNKIGTVELETDCVIPESWKGKEIQFLTAKGIDDLAEVYCNGTLLGKVTRDMPEYWMTPHCYPIPADRIRFGQPNRIRVVSENLRGEGGFNSCPELRTREERSESKLIVDRIGWLGKGGTVTEGNGAKRRFDTSLAFPGIRWEIPEKSIDMTLRDVAVFAAWSEPSGIVSVKLSETEWIPTGNWNAPWLLLYGGETPLLLVFEHRPGNLEIQKCEDSVSGLRITASGMRIGAIVPVWIFGKEPKKIDAVTPEIAERVRFWYPKALRYPVECDESFRLGKRVEIRSRYRYLDTRDDWNTPLSDYAPIPQLAWRMRNSLFSGEGVEPWPLETLFGTYAARPGSDTVFWSLPLPEASDGRIAPKKLPDALLQHANRLFQAGSRWSAGGKTRYDAWTPAFPTAKNFPECRNLSMHAWIMGLNQAWMAPWALTPENRKILEERTRTRFFEPIEKFAYKAATRYREEPFSRIAYPIFFNSFYRGGVHYTGRPASDLNYGDQNETAMMILSLGRKLADAENQRDLILANWKFFREAARLLLVSDDWGHLSCHCRESGEAATIDMLNCEYPAMLALARLAEIAGDNALRDQAIYRAARRMVPVLARIDFAEYAAKHNLVRNPESILISSGFDEEGAVFLQKGSRFLSIQLFDMSQGIEPDMPALYRKYAAESVRKHYLDAFQNDLRKPGTKNLSWENAACVAAFGTLAREEFISIFEHLAKNTKINQAMENDWIGLYAPVCLAFLPEK